MDPPPKTVPAPPGGPPGPLGHLPPGLGPLGPNYLDQIASIKAMYERNLAAVHAASGGGPPQPPSSGMWFMIFDCLSLLHSCRVACESYKRHDVRASVYLGITKWY